MDYGCECGNEVGGYDENYVVMCHNCGKNMKPLKEKTEPVAEVPCGVGLVCEACINFSQNLENEGQGDYPVDDLCAIADDPCMDRDGPNELWKKCPLKKAN